MIIFNLPSHPPNKTGGPSNKNNWRNNISPRKDEAKSSNNGKNGNGNKNNNFKRNDRQSGSKNVKTVEIEETPQPTKVEENPENVTLSQIMSIERIENTKN